MIIFYYAAFIFTLAGGIYLAGTILAYIHTGNYVLLQKFCPLSHANYCVKVLGSRYARISRQLTWADLALVYFSALFICSILTAISGSLALFFLAVVPFSMTGVALTLYFFYLQYFILRSWCRLCLLVTAVLWVQLALVLLALNTYTFNRLSTADSVSIVQLTAYFILSLGIASCWLLIKKWHMAVGKLSAARQELDEIRSSEVVFFALLRQQRRIFLHGWGENEFIIGARAAPIKLLLVMNPFCPACADKYTEALQLFERNLPDIALVIRFAVHGGSDHSLKAVKYLLLQFYKSPSQSKKDILVDWFADIPVDTSWVKEKNYPDDIEKIAAMHIAWTQKERIRSAPHVFINGTELPAQFGLSDLQKHIKRIIASVTAYSMADNQK